MKQIVYTCDICNKMIDESEIYHIKIKSQKFIDYVNQGLLGANKRTIEICPNCVKKFKEFINENIR